MHQPTLIKGVLVGIPAGMILIGVISIVRPKTIMSLLTEQSTSRGMQRHKMFDRRVYFDRTLLTTHIVVTRAIGMR